MKYTGQTRIPTQDNVLQEVLARAGYTGERFRLDRFAGIESDPGLRRFAAQQVRPRKKETPSLWAPRHCFLSKETEGNSGGPYDLKRFPYWRKIIDLIASPTVREVNLMISPQMGKTIAMVMILLFLAENAPCPCMYVLPTQGDAIWFRDRVYANALASPHTRHLVPPKSQWNARHIDLGGLRCYLAWAGGSNAVRSRSCRIVFCDEIDVYEMGQKGGDPVASARQRVGAFHRWQIWKLSSPVPEVSRIAEECEQSLMHHWAVCCPKCQHRQELRFFTHKEGEYAGCGGMAGIEDARGNPLTADEAKASAHYLCEKGCKLPPEAKFEMMRTGEWIAEGGDSGQSERLGFTLPLYLSDAHTLNEAASAYVVARAGGQLAGFFQQWLARSYTSRRPRPKWEIFAKRNAGSYERGTVPQDVWFLTSASDVQEDMVYFSVWGWGHLKRRYLIDWRVFYPVDGDDGDVVGSDIVQIDPFLERTYPIVGGENPRGLTKLRILMHGIDSGHRPAEVHSWVWRHRETKRVRAVRGDAHVDPSQRWRKSVITESRDGKRYLRPRTEYQIAVSAFKERLDKQMKGDIRKDGAVILPKGMYAIGPEVCKQLCNEEPRRIIKESGKKVIEWRPKTKAIGVDQWDCAVYSDALAEMVVEAKYGGHWDTNKWPKAGRPGGTEKLDSEGIVVR